MTLEWAQAQEIISSDKINEDLENREIKINNLMMS